MNIQFVVANDQVYVLEVNPRSSRTVPIMSKVTQIPMIEWATNVQLGDSLKDLHSQLGLLDEPLYYSIKAPIFSAAKLREVDHVLGPEMKSTGEVLGLGESFQEALEKAMFLGAVNPFKVQYEQPAYILCSIVDREKDDSIPYIQELIARGYTILATEGTADYFFRKGIPATSIVKDRTQIDQRLKQGDVVAILNIPRQGRMKDRFGFFLREQAVRYQIPCFTCLDTVKAAIGNGEEYHKDIRSMNDYYNRKVEFA